MSAMLATESTAVGQEMEGDKCDECDECDE
jgi:hypothetical protein